MKRIIAMVFVGMFLFSGIAYAETVLLTEDWENGIDSTKWYSWGSPSSYIASGLGIDGGDAIDVNGDGMWNSGVTTYERFELKENLTVTAWLNAHDYTGHVWQNVGIALTSLPAENMIDSAFSSSILVRMAVGGDNSLSKFRVRDIDGTIEEYLLPYDQNENGTYHQYRFSINSDNSVSFYIDGILEWISTAQLDTSLYQNAALTVSGRAYGTAEMLADDIKVTGNPVPEPNLEAGLVAYYPFNGNANDESGFGNDGIWNGEENYDQGIIGTAATLDGINDAIDINSTVDDIGNSKDGAISLWFKADPMPKSNGEYRGSPIGYLKNASLAVGLYLGHHTYKYTASIAYASGCESNYEPNSNSYFFDDQWHHAVVTLFDDRLSIYIDGQQLSLVERPNSYLTDSMWCEISDIAIGSVPGDDYYKFKGLIDEVRIYNRNLSEEEILELFNQWHLNTAPVATAGPDQTVIQIGTNIQLDATESYDPDGDVISYSWIFLSKPSGSTALLSDSGSAIPTFAADVHGEYEIELTVTDPSGAADSDTVIIDFENISPVADAGIDLSVIEGDTVHLDGSNSSDENLDMLSFNWYLTGGPAASTATISDSTAVSPTLVADIPGQYEVCLVVSDGFTDSIPDCMIVDAKSYEAAAKDTLEETKSIIEDLDLKKAPENKIDAVLDKIESGEYQEAINKLENDILKKVDGCIENGAPDNNDWDMDCDEQKDIYLAIIDAINLLKNKLGIAKNGAIIYTIDGLDFEKIFSKGEQPDFRPSYLKEALLSTSLSEHDIYAFGVDCYDSECDNSWSGDANYSEDYIGGLIDQIKYYSDFSEASNKKFIIVTHSWGTVLGSIALGYLQDSYEVKPDLFITLSSPLGSMNNQENLEDPFWIYDADFSIFESFEWLLDFIISGTAPNTVESWQTYIGYYLIVELNDIIKQLNLEMPYLAYNPAKIDNWINYWAMGDIISGPLDIKTKTIVPTESGDSVIILKKNPNIIK